mmetsp:Transcript_16514/g.45506  ORF Transcript_16514/g.45506 Transcript_16514/m.45506 type:complete len:332 (+) Transcript_16514:256-1251(+)|eukprot:CAMPEP_0172359172 /NCGR_PEP_ID=MMETSP1060-20121228/3408_1 /TAXON_ID=37318 /ORGANISM="Pseudo-nitzschia pungens, Strain cf. cingulata" /LENGTH=331 /DNA_ID=CAMNT_0013080711 /DNA_START=190 /DNA_END=1185 /DNA_ORIENTATION=+
MPLSSPTALPGSGSSLRAIAIAIVMLTRVGVVLVLLVRSSSGFYAAENRFQPSTGSSPFFRRHPSTSTLLRAEGRGEDRVRFRCGRAEDEPVIAFTMAKELMNPLGISHRNFVVAEDVSNGDRVRVVGWAQIRPLGPAAVDPSEFDSPPGSIPRINSVEDDVDELMWEEFENDTRTDFSGGRWQNTLPWTKEYKEAFAAADERLERRAELVAREEERRKQQQQQQQTEPRLWELASVYVVPERRSEGIGRGLVRSVLDEHRDLGRASESVYALTLSSTVDWYRSNFGFVTVTESRNIPKPMALEVAAGKIITKLMGNELVCLRMPLENILQ